MSRHWLTVDRFSKSAGALRNHFEQRFSDPRRAAADRFVWDYWHIPDQYTLLRTPAYHYFPQKLYQSLHTQLVMWGREFLGCHDISPPWLSCYVDGCEQELHADHPHGPWAFVFSLTPSQKYFRGGETTILRPEVIAQWPTGQPNGTEHGELFVQIAPRFNRLTVFDPRLPHGVRRVQGSKDPRHGRLVIHGWFVQPRPFWYGPLNEKDMRSTLDEGIEQFSAAAAHLPVVGQSSWRLKIAASGAVTEIKALTNTLTGDLAAQRQIVRLIKEHMGTWRFRKTRKVTHLTLPLGFGL